ncbi:MAG: FAD-dependent oxidoreductase [Methanomassiliicoccales archaeon]|nr:FAD-dependent oxidoreductase [Methanomassiliicoccales archaeon]
MLVIGGGTAGIASALSLAQRGIFVTIVEKDSSIGGRASELCCKGEIQCVKCDVCLSLDRLYEVAQSRYIRVLTNSEVARVSGKPGSYRVTVVRKKQFVREDACIACGKCKDVCPVAGSAIKPRFNRSVPMTYWIDKDKCIRMKGESCEKCSEICPTGAIDFQAKVSKRYLNVAAIIVANGFAPYEASKDRRLRYGEIKNVLTSLEIEKMLNDTGKLCVPSTGATFKKIGIIQCVGSRDERTGAAYCSKVCCKYSLKIAQLIKLRYPESEVSFFFMDWRPYDLVDNELLEWARKNQGVKIVRSRPAEIMESENGKPVVRYVTLTEDKIEEEEFDLVMLSIGIQPHSDTQKLSAVLGIELTPSGFVYTEDAHKGIFAAGCCTGPKDIEESFMEGVATANRVAAFIGGSK